LINLPGNLDGGNAYETLHSYLHNAISPFFDAYVSVKSSQTFGSGPRDDKDGKTGAVCNTKFR
jgi:dynein heavy chain 1